MAATEKGATPIYALPYPALTDPADVPLDMQELAVAVEARLKAGADGLAAETAARQGADQAESTARANADAAEAGTRAGADNTLDGKIQAETTARTNADTAETNARIAGDNNLQGQINNANTAIGTKVDVLAVVAAASTLVQAKLTGAAAQPAFRILGDGTLGWGDGGNALDAFIRRTGPQALRVDTQLTVNGGINAIQAVLGGDVTLSRAAANTLGVTALQATTTIKAWTQSGADMVTLGTPIGGATFKGLTIGGTANGNPGLTWPGLAGTWLAAHAYGGQPHLSTNGAIESSLDINAYSGGGLGQTGLGRIDLAVFGHDAGVMSSAIIMGGGDTNIVRERPGIVATGSNGGFMGGGGSEWTQVYVGNLAALFGGQGTAAVAFGTGTDLYMYRQAAGMLWLNGALHTTGGISLLRAGALPAKPGEDVDPADLIDVGELLASLEARLAALEAA